MLSRSSACSSSRVRPPQLNVLLPQLLVGKVDLAAQLFVITGQRLVHGIEYRHQPPDLVPALHFQIAGDERAALFSGFFHGRRQLADRRDNAPRGKEIDDQPETRAKNDLFGNNPPIERVECLFQRIGRNIDGHAADIPAVENDGRLEALVGSAFIPVSLGHHATVLVADDDADHIGLPRNIGGEDFQVAIIVSGNQGRSAGGGGIGHALTRLADQFAERATLVLDANHADRGRRDQHACHDIADKFAAQTNLQLDLLDMGRTVNLPRLYVVSELPTGTVGAQPRRAVPKRRLPGQGWPPEMQPYPVKCRL